MGETTLVVTDLRSGDGLGDQQNGLWKERDMAGILDRKMVDLELGSINFLS